MATLLSQIKLRRGTAAELDAMSPVLAEGEPAFSTDTHRFAIGDGKHNFSQLALRIKDGVTNVSGEANCINQIAVFSNNAGDDIVGRSVTIDSDAIMAGVKQIRITNDVENQAPLTIYKPVLVTNLNADLLDGKQGNEYFTADNLKFQKTTTQLPVVADGKNQLYVDIDSVAHNATITLSGGDITINNEETDSFTLNQSSDKTFTIAVTKDPSGGRKEGSIVSARASGIIQSNEYEISYTVSGGDAINVGATMVYDQALKAVKFVF